ncbi:MAG: FkbM family methyltransferase [Pseudomonadales bacterium]|nr:FkbM family methyltransferase [Pseudomonadales bacterium]
MSSRLIELQLGHLHADLADLQMVVHGDGDKHVSAALQKTGIWEAYESELIQQLLFTGATFIDVGANIGYYSMLSSRLVGESGQVVAFEPEQRNFSLLQKNIALLQYGNVTAVNAGLADEDSEAEIYLSDDNFGDHQIYDGGKARQKQTIKLRAGSDYLAQLPADISRIDVLKIDTQGAEMKVMTGLKDVIFNSLPDLNIIIEFWPYGLRQAQDHGNQLLDFLLSLNLPMAIIDHINHGLIPCQESDLRDWIAELDKDDQNEGFMNILLGHKLL